MSSGSLRLVSLRKSFGNVTAVNAVDLEVPRGQMLGIIGRSGAGKSTLLRLINRLVSPTSGEIFYDNERIDRLRGSALLAWRMRCAMIFQQFNLMPRLDVLTNVLIGCVGRRGTLSSLFKRFSEEEKARAIHLLVQLDLANHAFQRAETLSGGQQQRVAIARAQMQEPQVLLADEPIASLDPGNATRVMDALRAINREDGLTVLCNLHSLDIASKYCDRIIGLADGSLVFDGAPESLTPEVISGIYQISDDSVRSNGHAHEFAEGNSVSRQAEARSPRQSAAGTEMV